MDPLLQGLQAGLKTLTSPPPIKSSTTPVSPIGIKGEPSGAFKSATDFGTSASVGIVTALQKAFDALDTFTGTALTVPGAVVGNLYKSATGGQPKKLTPISLSEIGGQVGQTFFGSAGKLPGEIAGSLGVPVGSALKLGLLPLGLAIRTAKVAEVSKFAEEAALLTKPEDIASRALIHFPGLPKQTADALGSLLAAETDAAKIAEMISLPLKGAQRERGLATSAKAALPELKGEIGTPMYTQRPTVTSAVAAQNLVRESPEAAAALIREVGRLAADIDTQMFAAVEYAKYAAAESARLTKAGSTAAAQTLRNEASDLLDIVTKNATAAGRYSQAATMLARQTPEGIARFINKEITKFNEEYPKLAVSPLSKADTAALKEEWARIQEISDVDKKAEAMGLLLDKLKNRIPSTQMEMILSLWKANLLTGPHTWALNLSSSGMNTTLELIKNLPAAAVERVSARITGRAPTIGLTLRGLGAGGKEGLQKAARYMKTGWNEREAQIFNKMDIKKVNYTRWGTIGKGIQWYEERIFRFMGAMDMPFYYGTKANSLMSQAKMAGQNLGLKGEKLYKYMEELATNPTDDMLRNAVHDAEMAVFHNSTMLSRWARNLQRDTVLGFIFPFVRTPAAVAVQMINYSPMGIIKEIAIQLGKKEFNQRKFAQAAGRSITGAPIMWLGYEAYKNDLVSLAYPDTPTERSQWEMEGRIPWSVYWGGKWRSVSALGPQGLTMLLGAEYLRSYKETGSISGAAIQTVAVTGNIMQEQTFLKGLNQLTDWLNDPYKEGTNLFAGYIGSVVPTFVSDIARASDPTERKTMVAGTDSVAGGLFDRLYGRIPGLREMLLQPKVNTFGFAIPTPGVIAVVVDPTRPQSGAMNNPVVKELRRMMEAGYTITPTSVLKGKGYKSLTQEQNVQLLADAGKANYLAYQAIMASPGYAQMSDGDKEKLLDNVATEVRNLAKATLIAELTAGVSGQTLVDELKKHFDSQLLNGEVFKILLTIRPDIGQ